MIKFFTRSKKQTDSLITDVAHTKAGHFHSLKVSDIKHETTDCVSVAFELTDDLHDTYKFVPGQYLTIMRFFNGEDVRRS